MGTVYIVKSGDSGHFMRWEGCGWRSPLMSSTRLEAYTFTGIKEAARTCARLNELGLAAVIEPVYQIRMTRLMEGDWSDCIEGER